MAGEVATAFLDFKLRGLKRGYDRETWTVDFANAWNACLGKIGPMVKHPAFATEDEYRCIHTLDPNERGSLEFRQKGGMLAQHFPLFFPSPGKPRERMLPIVEVMVGPCRHPLVSKTSLELLLAKKGYLATRVTNSSVPFQMT